MGNKTIVLTMYGKGESIESISISLFDIINALDDRALQKVAYRVIV
jgi:hypothetical protein